VERHAERVARTCVRHLLAVGTDNHDLGVVRLVHKPVDPNFADLAAGGREQTTHHDDGKWAQPLIHT